MFLKKVQNEEPYNGNLTDCQIAEGINICKKNGRELLADAKLLFENQRFSSSIAFSILAIEEFGKEPLLREFAGVREGDSTSKIWKKLRNHQIKNSHWKIGSFLQQGLGRTGEELYLLTQNPITSECAQLDELKQNCLYTSFSPTLGWQRPAASEIQAKQLIEIAEYCIGLLPEVTEEQIKEQRALLGKPDLNKDDIKRFTDKWGHKDIPL